MPDLRAIRAQDVVQARGSPQAPAPEASDSTYRIAVIGCYRQDQTAPALTRYVKAEPDLAIWVGDNVYADTRTDPRVLDTSYAVLESRPAFRQLRRETPFMVTWDDHDYGFNNLGRHYALKDTSKSIFRRFWNLEAEIPPERPGIYNARTFDVDGRRLQVVMLDVRYNRDRPWTGGDMLGPEQRRWLDEQLRRPADLRLIVSGTQLLLPGASSSETWAKYPEARQRLFRSIRRSGAERVVFVTGDQHYAEVGRVDNALDYDAVELQFAGINQIEDPVFNPHRVTAPIHSKHSYALIDIQWARSAQDPPHLLFRVFDAMSNRPELIYRVNFEELDLDIRLTGSTRFVDRQTVSIEHSYPEYEARYTLDGTAPTANSRLYDGPFSVVDTTRVKARLFWPDGKPRSEIVEKKYRPVEPRPARASGGRREGLRYAYYEGVFRQLPRTDTLSAKKTGPASTLDVESVAEREDHFAVVYSGYLRVPATGLYTFSTLSDDGSRLSIGNRVVVSNDGSHSLRRRSGKIALQGGWHPIRLEYFEDHADQHLTVTYVPPGGSRTPIPMDQLSHD
ncbi:MAG: PA14 domain-containing protein [Salinibacter sp.]